MGHLRAAYEEAFHVLSSRAREWQSLTRSPIADETAVAAAKAGMDEALARYRARRDELALLLLADGPAAIDRRWLVESIAHQLWENEGRPEGHAETHWRRAEALVLSHR
ncbi:MAG: DUF2934 domain-containing protein [Bryobacteraceae bacterium]|nr:DUF2934 domain-containing protein [Bryobacteraceae bacterium]